MTRHQAEPLEVMVARIDERVKVVHETLPDIVRTVRRHDREMLVVKVVIACVAFYLMVNYPHLGEAIAKVIQ